MMWREAWLDRVAELQPTVRLPVPGGTDNHAAKSPSAVPGRRSPSPVSSS